MARLGTGWIIGLLSLVTVTAIGGGIFTYRMYDYVQHDNDFCLSCHLMADPFERFGQSAHRGLGCKACHQPTLVDRSTMALSQILENPDSLTAHAHVPNDRCVSCHVEGNPEEWIQVANSAGHRLHLESEEPALYGVQCVECHSSSVHEFTPAQETCGDSSCHENFRIQLGEMADLTVHCVACHSFSTPIAQVEGAPTPKEVLAPTRETCLSCHAMRLLVNLPEEDPHGGVCASCHNPHLHSTPQEAVQSCTNAGCHEDPGAETPFHQGLAHGVTDNCLACHSAHDFKAQGRLCIDCHDDIFRDIPPDEGQVSSRDAAQSGPGFGHPTLPSERVTPLLGGIGGPPLPPAQEAPQQQERFRHDQHQTVDCMTCHTWVEGQARLRISNCASCHDGVSQPMVAEPPPPPEQEQEVRFSHGQHRNVECTNCHTGEGTHGRLVVSGISDCRSCHHSTPSPVAEGCAGCHDAGSHPAEPYVVTRTMEMSVGQLMARDFSFDHSVHEGQDCGACHTEGLSLSAARVDCTGCHEEHHAEGRSCRSCHVEVTAERHPAEQVHVGCAGAGCHQVLPFGGGIPRNRDFCLTCHQEKTRHKQQSDDCTQCHFLPHAGPSAFIPSGGLS
jgi:nitrate/TMAO reductase-like tetraheme cytochrome c subunit